MMQVWTTVRLACAALYSFLAFGIAIQRQPGNTGKKASRLSWSLYRMVLNSSSPWSVKALRVELGRELDQEICEKFREAFNLQRQRQYHQARDAYQHLRSIILPDGSVADLYVHSEVFRHNWRLLKKHLE